MMLQYSYDYEFTLLRGQERGVTKIGRGVEIELRDGAWEGSDEH
jgi:hypothetical protein